MQARLAYLQDEDAPSRLSDLCESPIATRPAVRNANCGSGLCSPLSELVSRFGPALELLMQESGMVVLTTSYQLHIKATSAPQLVLSAEL